MSPTTRNTRYPIDERAQRILAAAFSEYSRRGVRSARLSVIARRAGVSAATLRQYFPTADELAREVVRSTIVRLIQHPPAADRPLPGAPIATQLRRFIQEYWQTLDDPDQVALLRLSLGELTTFPELAVFHATEVIGRAVVRLETMLMEATRRGQIQPRDHRALARVIVSALTMHGIWFASPAIYGDLTGLDRAQAEQAAIDALLNIVVERAMPAGPHGGGVEYPGFPGQPPGWEGSATAPESDPAA